MVQLPLVWMIFSAGFGPSASRCQSQTNNSSGVRHNRKTNTFVQRILGNFDSITFCNCLLRSSGAGGSACQSPFLTAQEQPSQHLQPSPDRQGGDCAAISR